MFSTKQVGSEPHECNSLAPFRIIPSMAFNIITLRRTNKEQGNKSLVELFLARDWECLQDEHFF
jgi:hypothetical protein